MTLLTQGDARLRKHADYQRVYQRSRKHFSPSMTYFFAERIAGPALAPASGPRVGLTAGRVLGKAVERNRIKRRMREAVRRNLALLTRDVDVILHPRRTVLTAEFDRLQGEVSRIFSLIQKTEKIEKKATSPVLDLYRRWISPLLHSVSGVSGACRFQPTCSEYAVVAMSRHGIFYGAALSLWRLLRCNPFARGGFDPVPGTYPVAPLPLPSRTDDPCHLP